jgi:hypothetical protein
MPTAFGNTIRAFEVYSRQVYGADAIAVWLRLAFVIGKEDAGYINGARAQVDCFVNVTCLSILIAAGALGCALICTAESLGGGAAFLGISKVLAPAVARSLLIAAAGIAVSVLSYRCAVARAAAWGEVVKSTFDCYLPALIKKLGYAIPPTEAERRAFWEQLNDRLLFQVPMATEWPLADQTNAQENHLSAHVAKSDAEHGKGEAKENLEADGTARQR